MNRIKFYRCDICGNLIAMIDDSGVVPECCGSPMTELIPGEVDAPIEKHLPVITRHEHCVSVRIGSVPHPMTEAHFISWVILTTDRGAYMKSLKPGEEPLAKFHLSLHEEPCAAYAYCNLHGLYMTEYQADR